MTELCWSGRLSGSGAFVEALPILPDGAAGLFETVRVTARDRAPPLWPRHRQRLLASLRALAAVDDGSVPVVAAQLDRFVAEILGHAVVALPARREPGVEPHERLRLGITFDPLRGPGGAVPGVRMSFGPADPAPACVCLAPVRFVADADLPSPAHKQLDRRAWTHAQAEARRRGADEALRIGDDGMVLESTTSNLFVVSERRLVTPPTDGRILPGVARAALLEQLRGHGVPVEERPVPQAELEAAEGLWLTNALRGPRPAVLFGRAAEPAIRGPEGALLISAWHRLVEG